MKDLIKKWDDELIEKHIGTEINYLRDWCRLVKLLRYLLLVTVRPF